MTTSHTRRTTRTAPRQTATSATSLGRSVAISGALRLVPDAATHPDDQSEHQSGERAGDQTAVPERTRRQGRPR